MIALASLIVSVGAAAVWLWTPDKPRSELEAKYLRAPGDLIDIAGVRLHVRDSGPRDAPVLVMLHGFGSSLHTWEPWAQVLEKEFRVVRFDLPGSGLSSPDPTGIYTDARAIEVLLALIERLDIERMSIIGNSVGGRIAWTFAARHPDRVSRLVLIAPDGFASPGFDYGKPPAIPSVLRLMQHVLPKAVLRMNLAPSYGDPAAITEQTVTRYHDLMLAPGVRSAVLARMEQTILFDPETTLRSIGVPVMLVWGGKDAMIPIRNADDYARTLPDSRLVAFPDLGHVPQEESPVESVVPVRQFLLGDTGANPR